MNNVSPKAISNPEPFEDRIDFLFDEAVEGGGGTDFRPVFDWVEHENRSPNMLVYFTDAEGDFPKLPPNYPVIWLVKGKGEVPISFQSFGSFSATSAGGFSFAAAPATLP